MGNGGGGRFSPGISSRSGGRSSACGILNGGSPVDSNRGKGTFPSIGSRSGRAAAKSTETGRMSPHHDQPSFGAASVAVSRDRCLPAPASPKALR